MGKEINRIRINRLYSENNIFDEIMFADGVNIILGEKYDNAIVQGRKTNGVGKSMCIEMLDFTLLCDYDKSRVSKIPKEVLPLEENIFLELEIGSDNVTIKRNRKDQDNPEIIRNSKRVTFDKLSDAREYLSELIFAKLNGKSVPSFRNLLSILIRDERSEFKDILKCHDLSKNIPDDLTVHLFMLGISLDAYRKSLVTIKEIDSITKIISRNKKELTNGDKKKIADVKAELNALDDELEKMTAAIESFKSNDLYVSLETELIELEEMLDQLRRRQKTLRYDYNKIKQMPKPEEIEDSEIELVYNEFKSNLGTAVVKSLNEVMGFKNKVESFQRMLINQKAKELEIQLKDIAEQIRVLDEDYSQKMKIIDEKGVLKNLKTSLKIYESKKDSFANTKFLYDQYEKNEKAKKALRLRKTQEIMELDNDIESSDRHPLFLVHDNIFDVDQDTLVQCLNYLSNQEEKYQDFQYILTLNRDKIENEERTKLINMDIDAHTVAKFTKKHKFLKRDYQEK